MNYRLILSLKLEATPTKIGMHVYLHVEEYNANLLMWYSTHYKLNKYIMLVQC